MNEPKILTPEEGMILYNAEKGIYSDKVYLGALDDAENWTNVPLSQYEEWLEENYNN